eukprot:jgi/Mesvir1/17922/Mv12985-RA.1
MATSLVAAPVSRVSFSTSRQPASRSSWMGKALSCRSASRPAARGSFSVVASFSVGQSVRVKEDVKVYHVPKKGELSLKGMKGTVSALVTEHKGKPISANLPVKVEFQYTKEDGKNGKFFAHMEDSELEAA